MMNNSYQTKLASILILTAMLMSTGGEALAAAATTETSAASTETAVSTDNLTSLKIGNLVSYDTDDTTIKWNATTATTIKLNGTTASITSGTGAAVDGSTITISSAGTYVLSGTLKDGSVIVDAGKKDVVRLILNGVTISNSDGAAIHVKKAGKTIVTLPDGTKNTISDGKTYVDASSDDAPTAAIFSKDDLTINGTGKLTVTGNYNDGITSKDTLKIINGTLHVTAVDDGIIGRDLTAVKDGDITIKAGGDGIKTSNEDEDKGYLVIEEGSFNIESSKDGMQAATYMLIDGGSFNIVAGGGSTKAEAHQEEQPIQRSAASSKVAQSAATAAEDIEASDSEESESDSMKGLKADAGIAITDGTIVIDAADDAVHSNGSIRIDGGKLTLATGDDGIHADTAIAITGGKIDIKESYEGIESAIIDVSGGEIHVVSSDDGINGSDGSGSDMIDGAPGGFGGQGEFGGKGQPEQSGQPTGEAPANTQMRARSGNQPAFVNVDQAAAPVEGQAPKSGENGEATQPGGMGRGASSNVLVTISGGHMTINAGGDGLDSNGSIVMTGGTVLINGPTSNGNGSLDYDGTFEMSGGVLVAAGSSGMVQATSGTSTQSSILMTFPSSLKAGTLVTLADSTGTPIISFTPEKAIQSVLFSTPDLATDKSYTIYTGGTSTGTSKDGLIEGGKLTGGTKIVSFTTSDIVTYVNESGVTTGGGGFGATSQGRTGGRTTTEKGSVTPSQNQNQSQQSQTQQGQAQFNLQVLQELFKNWASK